VAQSKRTAGEASQKKSVASQKDSSDRAEDRLRIRLQINPHDPVAHKELVALLEKKSAFRAVFTEHANWLKNNPSDSVSLIELVSWAKTALHDPEFAIAQERWVLDHSNRAEDDLTYDRNMGMLAADLDKRGRPQEALKIVDELIRLNPEDETLQADRATPLLHLGRVAEAVQSLRRSLQSDSSSETLHEALADALATSGDLAGAESEYRASLSVYNAKYKRGDTTNALDSLVKGLVKIEASNRAEHALAQTHLKLARVLMRQKKWTDAVKETQAALDADNNELGAYYLRAEIYDAQSDRTAAAKAREAARAAVMELTKHDKASGDIKADPRILFMLGTNDDDANEPSTAFPSEILAILEPRIADLTPMERVILSDAYLDTGRTSDAVRQFDKAISMDSSFDTAVAHGNLGQRLLRVKALPEALPHLQRAYELDPQNMTFMMDYQTAKEAAEAQKRPAR